ncbi:MAG: hypothetical protein WD871_01910 [Xanthobacteraceae bacterium]
MQLAPAEDVRRVLDSAIEREVIRALANCAARLAAIAQRMAAGGRTMR